MVIRPGLARAQGAKRASHGPADHHGGGEGAERPFPQH